MHLLFSTPHDQVTDAWRRLLTQGHPGLRFSDAAQPVDLDDVDVMLAYAPPAGLAARCPALKAIFSLAVGVDHLLRDAQLPAVPIARMNDPRVATMLTEYVLTAVLRHHRDFDLHEEAAAQGRWVHRVPRITAETRVGILGAGSLGLSAARALARNGFQVCVWSRTAKHLPDVTSLVGPEGLDVLVRSVDILVVMLPGTPETQGIVGDSLLARLKPGACIVNAGRGQHVDVPALLRAIDSQQVRAATLDVFDEEPLPEPSPLWRHPRVLVTPHVGSFSTPSTAAPHVLENLRRLSKGQELLGLVDRSLGY